LLSLGLTVPPLPDPLPAPMRKIEPYSFDTRPGDDHLVPLHFRNFFGEWQSPSRHDFALIECYGVGQRSGLVLHYHVRWRGNRILLRFVWGGSDVAKERERTEICRAFSDLHALWPALATHSAHTGPIVVAHDDWKRAGVGMRGGVESARWCSGEMAEAITWLRRELGLPDEKPSLAR